MKRIFRAAVALLCLVAPLVITPPQPAAAASPFVAVASAYDHSCALNSAGEVYCWGSGTFSVIGDGATAERRIPTKVSTSQVFRSISVGRFSNCAINTEGAAYCWGQSSGLGTGRGTEPVPAPVQGGHQFKSISAGAYVTCAIDISDDLYCWGDNNLGRVGDGSGVTQLAPVRIGSAKWLSVSSSSAGRHTCGLTTTGDAYCWGRNLNGQLGDGTTDQQDTPAPVSTSVKFKSMALGESHTCAIAINDAAYCWGHNGQQQLGSGNYTAFNTPNAVLGGVSFSKLSGSSYNTCGLSLDKRSYCWGQGTDGAVGNGGTSSAGIPQETAGGYRWLDNSSGRQFTCGITNGGGIMCWGLGTSGRLGNDSVTGALVPVVAFAFIGTNNAVVGSVVDPSLTFTVSGRSTACNSGPNPTSDSSSTGTALSLGRISAASAGVVTQNLTVSTNAGNSLAISQRYSGQLQNGSGQAIADLTGFNVAFPSAGTSAFGYQADWQASSNWWNRFTTTDRNIWGLATPTASTTRCITYKAQPGPTTPAGTYSTTVIYTAVPGY